MVRDTIFGIEGSFNVKVKSVLGSWLVFKISRSGDNDGHWVTVRNSNRLPLESKTVARLFIAPFKREASIPKDGSGANLSLLAYPGFFWRLLTKARRLYITTTVVWNGRDGSKEEGLMVRF